jgi:CTP synthase (UTP-ammonia lyase)
MNILLLGGETNWLSEAEAYQQAVVCWYKVRKIVNSHDVDSIYIGPSSYVIDVVGQLLRKHDDVWPNYSPEGVKMDVIIAVAPLNTGQVRAVADAMEINSDARRLYIFEPEVELPKEELPEDWEDALEDLFQS